MQQPDIVNTNPSENDPIWQLAKKRVAFKNSLGTYVLFSLFFVAIWYFTSGRNSYFWPVWPILGWGLGIVMQYLNAYHGANLFSTEEEYKKLKNRRDQSY